MLGIILRTIRERGVRQGGSAAGATQKTTQKTTQKAAQKAVRKPDAKSVRGRDTAQTLLAFLKGHATASISEMAERFGLSAEGVKWNLRKLRHPRGAVAGDGAIWYNTRLMYGVVKFFGSVGWAGRVAAGSAARFPSVLVRRTGRADLFRQLYATGIRTLPVVTVVSFVMGMILALQIGVELARFNQEAYLGSAVMLTLLREMGSFCCGLCLAACVGSAIAAELGTMKVNDEVDALVIMRIPPMRFLAAPRVLALVLMAPVLAFYCCIMGAVGGGVVGATQLNVDFSQYMSSALWMADVKDLYVGLLKATLFGFLIGVISVSEGLGTTRGATGVGKATQRAVIVSFLAILISGYMVTRAFT